MKKVIIPLFVCALIPVCVQAYVFNRDLTLGSSGDDVVALQEYLVSHNVLSMPISVPYGYFGQLTKQALIAYQKKYAISPATGYFGPITRTYVSNVVTTTSQTPSPLTRSNVVSQKEYFGEAKTTSTSQAPIIESVSPATVGITDRITVTGKQFGSKVTIYTSLGILKDKKVKDGTVIFNLSEIIGNVTEVSGMPVTFSIGTSKGISSDYGHIMIK